MNRGVNRASRIEKLNYLEAKIESREYRRQVPCIFISYQRDDYESCRRIADYIKNAGIDIYFDDDDKTLAELTKRGRANEITKAIQDGIDKSSHMLCVISRSTVKSYWVPFEIGYGYQRIGLGVLTLKGIDDGSLPDYLKTTDVIRGTQSLNLLIARLLGQAVRILENKGAIHRHSRPHHMLDSVLDWGQ